LDINDLNQVHTRDVIEGIGYTSVLTVQSNFQRKFVTLPTYFGRQ